MERAGRVFRESTLPMHYATLVCGRASASGDIELCNAGHLPPLLVGPRGVATVDATGLPIGTFSATSFAPVTVRLAPGETLLLYSDGLIEAENADGTRLRYGPTAHGHGLGAASPSLARLVDACVSDVAAFRGRPAVRRRPDPVRRFAPVGSRAGGGSADSTPLAAPSLRRRSRVGHRQLRSQPARALAQHPPLLRLVEQRVGDRRREQRQQQRPASALR